MTPPTSPETADIETIAGLAAALTEAQRKVFLLEAVREGDKIEIRWLHQTTGACRCALARKGLLKDRMFSTEFTPLGEQVRNYLLSGDPQ